MRTRTKPNQDIRDMLKDNGLTQWDLCKALGIGETTLYRRLRDELPEDQKQEYMKVIERLIIFKRIEKKRRTDNNGRSKSERYYCEYH